MTGTLGYSKCTSVPLCIGNFPAGGVTAFLLLGVFCDQLSWPSSNAWESSLCSGNKQRRHEGGWNDGEGVVQSF